MDIFTRKIMDMTESRCYLCQEPERIVGHNTKSCPFVKCRNCGKEGHVRQKCPDLFNEDFKKVLVVKYAQKSNEINFVLSSCVEIYPHEQATVDVVIREKGLTCIKNIKLNVPGSRLTSRFPMKIEDATKVLSLNVINTSNEAVPDEFFDYFFHIELYFQKYYVPTLIFDNLYLRRPKQCY